MPNFVFCLKQLFRLVYFFLFFSQLFGQGQSKIVHTDIISENDRVEISFIFDKIIDRDDVSGWIDRTNYFTLSLFNISLHSAADIFDKDYKYPLISVETVDTEGSAQIIINTAKALESYQLIRHSKGKNLLVILNYLVDEEIIVKDDGELVQSFIVEELPDTFDIMKDRWRHPSTWKDARERSSIRILCDTKDLPIYVDNQLIGKSPLDFAVDVLPGWHQVGYFPNDPALMPNPRSPKEKMMDNILRMGVLDVYVEEGKEQEIVLNYQNLDQDVLAFQKSITAGSWIGFSLFFVLIMLISWGIA